jgi:hypothetical protein
MHPDREPVANLCVSVRAGKSPLLAICRGLYVVHAAVHCRRTAEAQPERSRLLLDTRFTDVL